MSELLPLQAFLSKVEASPSAPYLHQPVDGNWTTYSFAEVDAMARKIAAALLDQGFVAGDRIALLGKNSAEWLITDIAIMMAGMVSVPIYSTAGVDTISYILKFSEAKAVFVGKLDDTTAASQCCGDILSIAFPYPTIECDVSWNDWIDQYSPLPEVNQPVAEDMLTMLFTSGSTGVPKGVPLTYKNLEAGIKGLLHLFEKGQHRILSYLPMAHITERTVVTYASLYSSLEIFFNESLATFVDDLRHAKVTTFLAVPRLWAKFQAQVFSVIPQDVLEQQLQSEQGPAVAAQIREQLGFGDCKVFGSGTAPIAPSLLRWYQKLGVDIGEGWGMTETTGMACSNTPCDPEMLGTIGKPSSNVEMKLGDNGEILIRGEGVFKEYYRNPEATAAAFDDGWFKTGDKGSVDENGAWSIVGRVKEQFKTAKGKYVVPVPIESLLSVNPYIEQICVLGSGMAQPVALVVLNVAGKHGDADIAASLQTTLEEVNGTLESHTRLDGILITKEPWGIENDLLTPTLKLKRDKIEARFRDAMEASPIKGVVWES